VNAPQQAAQAMDQAGRSDYLEHLARVGLIAYGLVHVLIGWLALQLAWFGGSGESADQAGALDTLSQTPVGGPLLWVLGIGLFALAAWQAAEVLRWRHDWSASGDRRKKALFRSGKAVAKAVIYTVFGVLFLQVANGNEQESSNSEEQATEGVLALPGGRFIVGAVALAVIGVAVYHVYKGVTKKFLEQIDLSGCSPKANRFITRVGQVGYPGKGVALLLVGGLLGWAAITFDADKAAGLDEALRTVQDAPLGTWVLTLIALGLISYGVFCFARARYPERQ
jgi:Domain of Unknown Function (DUF1206)